MTIGERLEEARKRKGISIREVAEATKIRSDFLMAMEDNSMDFNLPDIYKRGFLRNYARFLKLDPDKILTDYDAQFRGSSTLSRERAHNHHEDRPVFGRMELPPEEDEASVPAPRDRLYDPSSGEAPPPEEPTRREPPSHPSSVLQDNTLYLKIAAGLMGAVLVVVLIFAIVSFIGGDDDTAANGAATTATAATGAAPATSPGPGVVPPDPTTLTLRATENNVTVIVDDVRSGTRLYSSVMREGQEQAIPKNGPLLIKFSRGSAIELTYPNGTEVEGLPTGMGQFTVR